jgi:hypothetical protein
LAHDAAAACTPDGNGITYNEHINVALAVAMPDGGLITPVIKDADTTDIYQISRNWADLVKRARSKQLAPDEFQSGTFTISNLGNFGADVFDAILPPGLRPPSPSRLQWLHATDRMHPCPQPSMRDFAAASFSVCGAAIAEQERPGLGAVEIIITELVIFHLCHDD